MKHSNNDYSAWLAKIERVGLRGFLAASAPERFDLDQVGPGFLEWWLDEAAKTPVHVVKDFVSCTASVDTCPHLSRIGVPTLVVTPGDDALTSLDYVRPLVEDIPHARLVVLEGRRHNITDSAPEHCAQELLRFLGVLRNGD